MPRSAAEATIIQLRALMVVFNILFTKSTFFIWIKNIITLPIKLVKDVHIFCRNSPKLLMHHKLFPTKLRTHFPLNSENRQNSPCTITLNIFILSAQYIRCTSNKLSLLQEHDYIISLFQIKVKPLITITTKSIIPLDRICTT